MSIFIRHKRTGNRYLLLGAGIASEEKLCVCDQQGAIEWIDSSEATIERVDGERVIDCFKKGKSPRNLSQKTARFGTP